MSRYDFDKKGDKGQLAKALADDHSPQLQRWLLMEMQQNRVKKVAKTKVRWSGCRPGAGAAARACHCHSAHGSSWHSLQLNEVPSAVGSKESLSDVAVRESLTAGLTSLCAPQLYPYGKRFLSPPDMSHVVVDGHDLRGLPDFLHLIESSPVIMVRRLVSLCLPVLWSLPGA